MAGLIFLWNQPAQAARMGRLFRAAVGALLRPLSVPRIAAAEVGPLLRPLARERRSPVLVGPLLRVAPGQGITS